MNFIVGSLIQNEVAHGVTILIAVDAHLKCSIKIRLH